MVSFSKEKQLHQIVIISCADAADAFCTGARRKKDRLTNVFDGKTNGNGNLFEVHADERAANIKTRICFDLLHSHRTLEVCVSRGGKGAACLGLGNNVHDLSKRNCFLFHDDRAVEMLTALRRDVNALFVKYRGKTRVMCRAYLGPWLRYFLLKNPCTQHAKRAAHLYAGIFHIL